MDATTVALWVERFAFCLLLCSANIGSCGLVILVLSNFLCYNRAMIEKADTVRLKPHRSLKNSDSRNIVEQFDGKNALDQDEGEDSTMKSALLEILGKATSEENIPYWDGILVNKLEDKFKKYRALCEEELRKAKEICEDEFRDKLKIMEERLEAKYDDDRRKWEKERRFLKEEYEMMRWT
ncbi:PREDICTED: uncharacterized protein LOC105136256 isoform X1 [Populus euphratica]|uniref:Uncharacterized protein LOC105136256 isoform X1 n=1 Tax=Populus euphratica TaxID=75702 RepID=A0AAJ6V2S4_POPEU|nr:PREDICTED: uncharacterized protein LOC105136256 isoform X1 [Populus euphratica]